MSKKKRKTLWAVLKLQSWNNMTAGGHPLISPDGGMDHFLPVFNTKSQAVKFAGDAALVQQIELAPETE